jgi:hypothetical protein
MPAIYSTLSNDRSFPRYNAPKPGARLTRHTYSSAILIKGGANVADKHFQTQKFIATEVTVEELKALEENASFKRLMQRGFLGKNKPHGEKRDLASPKTDAELKAKAGKKGVEVRLNTDTDES